MMAVVRGKVLSMEARATAKGTKYQAVTCLSERGSRSEVFTVRFWGPTPTTSTGAALSTVKLGSDLQTECTLSAYVDRQKGVAIAFDVYADHVVEREDGAGPRLVAPPAR